MLPYVINGACHTILFRCIMIFIGRIIKIVELWFIDLIMRVIINIVLKACVGAL